MPAEKKKPAKKGANPGPASKSGIAHMVWCTPKDPADRRLCTYTDQGVDKKSKVMRTNWNGVVDPKSVDQDHLCPLKIRARTCPAGFKTDVLKVCNHPDATCVYAKGQGMAFRVNYGKAAAGKPRDPASRGDDVCGDPRDMPGVCGANAARGPKRVVQWEAFRKGVYVP